MKKELKIYTFLNWDGEYLVSFPSKYLGFLGEWIICHKNEFPEGENKKAHELSGSWECEEWWEGSIRRVRPLRKL